MSTFQIVGYQMLNCLGLASHKRLQNIHGKNWPFPPLSLDCVSYVYIDENGLSDVSRLTDSYDAQLRSEDVYVDDNRYKLIINDIYIILLTILLYI